MPSFDSPENIRLALSITLDSSLELVLYPKHYTEVHKQLMYPQSCASCVDPKKEQCLFDTAQIPQQSTGYYLKTPVQIKG